MSEQNFSDVFVELEGFSNLESMIGRANIKWIDNNINENNIGELRGFDFTNVDPEELGGLDLIRVTDKLGSESYYVRKDSEMETMLSGLSGSPMQDDLIHAVEVDAVNSSMDDRFSPVYQKLEEILGEELMEEVTDFAFEHEHTRGEKYPWYKLIVRALDSGNNGEIDVTSNTGSTEIYVNLKITDEPAFSDYVLKKYDDVIKEANKQRPSI